MAHADFIHLRVHSAYSLSEGAITVKAVVDLAKKNAMPAVAITDTGNLFGALEFALAAKDYGVQPIIGTQLNLARGDNAESGAVDQLVLLVQDEAGYGNLLKLMDLSYRAVAAGLVPRVTLDELAEHGAGLIALTGGPAGPVGRLLQDGQEPAAAHVLDRLQGIFPNRLYVELMRHGLAAEQRIEPLLVALADARGLPLVATNDVFFADAAMHEAHDALLCIADGEPVSKADRRRVTAEHRFKSAAEMRALFADLPDAVDNTLTVARRCAYMPGARQPILPTFASDEAAELRRQGAEGLERRLALMADQSAEALTPYRERLEMELGVIIKMGFAGYFLIVADFIRWALAHNIPVGPGRGSGAGSVVAWSLNITDLDPLRWGLLFERFLNPERVSMPDFDIDFCQDRRDEVIRYVRDKYGSERVAQIITFGKLQARAVLRDVGRVLEMPYPLVDRICKLVPNNPANPVTLPQAIEREPLLRHQIETDEQVGRMAGIAQRLEGLYRHASTHAAGVVIGDRPLVELVPLYRDARSDMLVTQFNMKYVETAGLVKFDFLGLKTLTVLQKAVELLKARGVDLDLSNLPLDDPGVYAMLSRADVTGVFQLESAGMRDVLRKLKPDRFEDIIAVVALYRPGPMDNIPRFIACKHGEETPDYLHPLLEPVLKETYGVAVYQEQVMQIAQVLSGYTLGGADLLRRAMGKKIKSEMDAQRETFVEGAAAKKIDRATAEHIFAVVEKFAGYGFNKSHAAAYALVAYQTAYLKANYPVEFMAASMTLDMGSTDKLNVFRQELDRLKIRLLPPDVNRSEVGFAVEMVPANGVPQGNNGGGPAIRYALAAIKGVGAEAMKGLVTAREAGGRFRDLDDLARRLDPRQLNRKMAESLVKAGALDSLGSERGRLFAAVEPLLKLAHAEQEDRVSQQASLFGGAGNERPRMSLPDVPSWTSMEKLGHEFEAIGFYLSAHPLDGYGASLDRLDVVPSTGILARVQAGGSSRVRLAGVVIAKQERVSAKTRNRFAFVQLSDRAGVFEVMVFSEMLSAYRDLLEPGKPLLITADARVDAESVRLSAQDIRPLDDAVATAAAGLKVFVRDPAPLPKLRQLIQREGRPTPGAASGRGRGKVRLVLDLDDREVELALPEAYMLSAQLRQAIKSLPGVVDVRDM